MFLDIVKLQQEDLNTRLVDCGLQMQTHCTETKALLRSITYHADPLDPLNKTCTEKVSQYTFGLSYSLLQGTLF